MLVLAGLLVLRGWGGSVEGGGGCRSRERRTTRFFFSLACAECVLLLACEEDKIAWGCQKTLAAVSGRVTGSACVGKHTRWA